MEKEQNPNNENTISDATKNPKEFNQVEDDKNIDIITTGPKERNDLIPSNNLVRWESLIVLNKNNYYTQECYNLNEKYLTDNYDKLKKYNPNTRKH